MSLRRRLLQSALVGFACGIAWGLFKSGSRGDLLAGGEAARGAAIELMGRGIGVALLSVALTLVLRFWRGRAP